MKIIVKKPTEAEKQAMLKQPVWSCEASEFDWFYESEETCLITEGEGIVEYNGGSVNIGEGDYVVFPEGLSCIWKVKKAVRKHYIFR